MPLLGDKLKDVDSVSQPIRVSRVDSMHLPYVMIGLSDYLRHFCLAKTISYNLTDAIQFKNRFILIQLPLTSSCTTSPDVVPFSFSVPTF